MSADAPVSPADASGPILRDPRLYVLLLYGVSVGCALVISAGLVAVTGNAWGSVAGALVDGAFLAPGRWGVLHVFEGSLRFVDLATGEERTLSAPDLITIHPQAPHRVQLEGPLRCRIDFFREPDGDSPARTPGAFADEAVRQSLVRCEANGNFGEAFYNTFLNSSPEIAPYFAATDFERQWTLLRNSVYMMASHDAAEPEMRESLERLGQAHSRNNRNVRPELYELWLDSICETAKRLDPQWEDELERKWRVRLRAGMQIIMAAY